MINSIGRLQICNNISFSVEKVKSEDKAKYDTFFSISKAGIVINESDIDDVFQLIYTTVIQNMRKSLGKRSGLIIDSIIDNTISISKYNL